MTRPSARALPTALLLAAGIGLLAPGCSSTKQEASATSPAPAPKAKPKTTSPESSDEEETPDDAPHGATKPKPSTSTATVAKDPAAGSKLFGLTVLPVFQKECISCHADPRQPVTVRGPETIYSYDSMKKLLASGKGPKFNGLYDKVRNVASHTGGDRCAKGDDLSPCKELQDWWAAEFGAASSGSARLGALNPIGADGQIFGWAADPAHTDVAVTVSFYVDQPKERGGTLAGQTAANIDGADGNTPGAHAFSFKLPDTFRTGKARDLYAYATINGVDQPLSDTAVKYTAYAYTAAGRSYYDANVKGKLQACTSCHTISYEDQWRILVTPSPAQGATATNNTLINTPSQTNGVKHDGGTLCSSISASPCAEFQTWWQTEFGSL